MNREQLGQTLGGDHEAWSRGLGDRDARGAADGHQIRQKLVQTILQPEGGSHEYLIL